MMIRRIVNALRSAASKSAGLGLVEHAQDLRREALRIRDNVGDAPGQYAPHNAARLIGEIQAEASAILVLAGVLAYADGPLVLAAEAQEAATETQSIAASLLAGLARDRS